MASACFSILISYLCMTGYSASASRAVIMILVYMLADVLGRTSDGANTLGIATVILLWINPYNIVNSAFWLSFLAMSGIIFVKPLLSDDKSILIYVKRPDKKNAGFSINFIQNRFSCTACVLQLRHFGNSYIWSGP
ncbi:MAG: ComEC/Rec2 family competence protein [Lachnospira eligens]